MWAANGGGDDDDGNLASLTFVLLHLHFGL